MPYDEGMPLRGRPSSKELLYTVAPLAIAAGFAFAAHGGWLCNGVRTTKVKVVAKANPGTSVSVYHDGVEVKAKRRRARKRRNGVDPQKLGTKIYRATETHWVPRSVVQKLDADPGLLYVYGDLVPVTKCAGYSGIIGYRVENTTKQGLFRKLGFHDGDLITQVDGERINEVEDLGEYVLGADQVTVTILRGEHTLQKTFLLE